MRIHATYSFPGGAAWVEVGPGNLVPTSNGLVIPAACTIERVRIHTVAGGALSILLRGSAGSADTGDVGWVYLPDLTRPQGQERLHGATLTINATTFTFQYKVGGSTGLIIDTFEKTRATILAELRVLILAAVGGMAGVVSKEPGTLHLRDPASGTHTITLNDKAAAVGIAALGMVPGAVHTCAAAAERTFTDIERTACLAVRAAGVTAVIDVELSPGPNR